MKANDIRINTTNFDGKQVQELFNNLNINLDHISDETKTNIIEKFLMGMYENVSYIYYDYEKEHYKLLCDINDNLAILNSFLKDEFKLTSTFLYTDLENKTFSEMPNIFKNKLSYRDSFKIYRIDLDYVPNFEIYHEKLNELKFFLDPTLEERELNNYINDFDR